MGKLKELNDMPRFTVNDIVYVPEKLYKEYIASRLEAESRDYVNKDIKDGIDYAIITVLNS